MSSNARVGIVNRGPLAWAFRDFAERMADVLWLEVTETIPARYLLLAWDGDDPPGGDSFIPFESIRVACDKRLIAERFAASGVDTPETHLLASWSEVVAMVAARDEATWALKYPTASGGSGHRLLSPSSSEPRDWPKPFVVQRFVPMERPEVFRIYAAGGDTFGFNVRRFPPDTATSPWVAHARGARYERAGVPPEGAVRTARAALAACGQLDSFGSADLVRDGDRWLALEVGTDGACGHVDRDVGDDSLVDELDRCFAEAFWTWVGETPPWAPGAWRRR